MAWTTGPSRTSTRGLATRLEYQTGFLGAPPIEATAAYSPSCSTRISGTLRTLPDFAPRVVTMITGISRIVVPEVPPDPSYSSTLSRTHSAGLGSYSPFKDMTPLNTRSPGDAQPAYPGSAGDVLVGEV